MLNYYEFWIDPIYMSSRVNSKTTIALLNSSATTRRGGYWSDARSPVRSSPTHPSSKVNPGVWSHYYAFSSRSHHMWDIRDKLWRPERPIIARRWTMGRKKTLILCAAPTHPNIACQSSCHRALAMSFHFISRWFARGKILRKVQCQEKFCSLFLVWND